MKNSQVKEVIDFLNNVNKDIGSNHIEETIIVLLNIQDEQIKVWNDKVSYVHELKDKYSDLAKQHNCELEVSVYVGQTLNDLSVYVKKNDYRCELLSFDNNDENIEVYTDRMFEEFLEYLLKKVDCTIQ